MNSISQKPSSAVQSGTSEQNDDRKQSDLIAWIEAAVASAPNSQAVAQRLRSIKNQDQLLNFLHRFLLFNDALAARVPYLAGLLHLTQGLFEEPGSAVGFNRVRNGMIAAYVAEAASDEYRMVNGRNLVHQHLSQVFFNGVLEYFGVGNSAIGVIRPLPPALDSILADARSRFFVQPSTDDVLAGLGFHLGLEFFAHDEFNQVDRWLKADYAPLVHWLIHDKQGQNAYLWLATHTVVEIHHYHAGLEAVKGAVKYCTLPDAEETVSRCVKSGFDAFVALQANFYKAILVDYE